MKLYKIVVQNPINKRRSTYAAIGETPAEAVNEVRKLLYEGQEIIVVSEMEHNAARFTA